MHEKKEDCDCHHRHRYYHRGYSTVLKRTSEKVVVPQDLLDVAEIAEGEFVEIIIRKVHKHSEMKKYHHKHHYK
ncbi:MAG: hypothetical protein Q7I96_06920 [Methanobacteriaceae archaeon]|nr:hypothetical protein [Methanobacteriaceae archaeon]